MTQEGLVKGEQGCQPLWEEALTGQGGEEERKQKPWTHPTFLLEASAEGERDAQTVPLFSLPALLSVAITTSIPAAPSMVHCPRGPSGHQHLPGIFPLVFSASFLGCALHSGPSSGFSAGSVASRRPRHPCLAWRRREHLPPAGSRTNGAEPEKGWPPPSVKTRRAPPSSEKASKRSFLMRRKTHDGAF